MTESKEISETELRAEKEPLVSVIVPAYNRAHLLKRCIDSVLGQTYKNIELILIDNASSDNTGEIIQQINDDRLKYFRLKVNRGASGGRNEGLRHASGDYVIFLDSDDEFLPDKIKESVSALENADEKFGVVYSGYWEIDLKGKKTYMPEEHNRLQGNLNRQLLHHGFITCPSLIRRAVFDKVEPFDEKLKHLDDWDLWIRISFYYHFLFIDKPLHVVYVQPDSISLNLPNMLEARKRYLEKYGQIIKNDPEMLAWFNYNIGAAAFNCGRMAEATHFFIKAWLSKPWSWHYLRIFLLSLPWNLPLYEKLRKGKKKKEFLHENCL